MGMYKSERKDFKSYFFLMKICTFQLRESVAKLRSKAEPGRPMKLLYVHKQLFSKKPKINCKKYKSCNIFLYVKINKI